MAVLSLVFRPSLPFITPFDSVFGVFGVGGGGVMGIYVVVVVWCKDISVKGDTYTVSNLHIPLMMSLHPVLISDENSGNICSAL